ncbi:MAG: SulP family inorganic anion transporter, partial [Sphingomonadales bacterium]|nr:SulP family inorganic anion transporter [Sphingomonadales bacterium]
TMALRHGDNVVAGRELAALGVANVAAALARGMPVGAGFSAGSAADAAGSVSRLTGAIAALALLVMALFGSALIALIPEPVLAAVVIAALAHALSPEPFVRLVRIDRDQWIAAAAAGGVLALGVLDGMLAAVALSLIALLRDFSKPKVCTLGRTGPDGHDFVDRANHPEAVAVAGIGIYRPNAPLFFANAETALAEVARRAAADRARVVVLSLEETSDLDSTAAEALGEFAKAQAQAGRSLVFARLHDAARAVLAATGLTQDADEGTFSVADAVDRATILLSKPAPARSA